MADREYIERITKELMDKGKLIEAGWISMRMMSIPIAAPPLQVEEMRNAFFAGAQHLFGSIITALDSGEEPTAADERRLDLINDELNEFIREFELKQIPPQGRA